MFINHICVIQPWYWYLQTVFKVYHEYDSGIYCKWLGHHVTVMFTMCVYLFWRFSRLERVTSIWQWYVLSVFCHGLTVMYTVFDVLTGLTVMSTMNTFFDTFTGMIGLTTLDNCEYCQCFCQHLTVMLTMFTFLDTLIVMCCSQCLPFWHIYRSDSDVDDVNLLWHIYRSESDAYNVYLFKNTFTGLTVMFTMLTFFDTFTGLTFMFTMFTFFDTFTGLTVMFTMFTFFKTHLRVWQ